jgi:hypothetical protein
VRCQGRAHQCRLTLQEASYGRTYSAVSEAFSFSSAGAWTSTQRLTRLIEVSWDAKTYTDTVALVEAPAAAEAPTLAL